MPFGLNVQLADAVPPLNVTLPGPHSAPLGPTSAKVSATPSRSFSAVPRAAPSELSSRFAVTWAVLLYATVTGDAVSSTRGDVVTVPDTASHPGEPGPPLQPHQSSVAVTVPSAL